MKKEKMRKEKGKKKKGKNEKEKLLPDWQPRVKYHKYLIKYFNVDCKI